MDVMDVVINVGHSEVYRMVRRVHVVRRVGLRAGLSWSKWHGM
jgi:hypothetical protein